MQRMRQNPGPGRWSTAQLLRSVEESSQADRRPPTTRLGLSELSSLPGSRTNPESVFDTGRTDLPGLSLPPPQNVDLPLSGAARSARSMSNGARIAAYSRARGGQVLQRSGNLEVNADSAGPCGADGDIDIFHDCMDLEENATFSNMFDDLDLEGSEVIPEKDEQATAFPQPDNLQRGPIFDPVASTGNNSRGSSCKRKSCNMPSTASGFHDSISTRHIHDGIPNQQNVEFSQRSLMLPPPSTGASSSRSATLMEGPRPQKTRLSADALDSTLGGVFPNSRVMPEFGTSSNTNNDLNLHPGEPSQAYPRAVRRAFPPGSDSFRSRRSALLDFSSVPDPSNYSHLPFPGGPAARDGNASVALFGSARASRIQGGGSAIVGGQGLSRRIGRISSNRNLAASPSISSHREQSESRMRSIRMACLENGTHPSASNHGPSIRRGVANYLPALGARHPSLSEARQGFSGRSPLFARSPPGISAAHSMAPPQVPISLVEAPEMRPPPSVFDGAQAFRHPALAVGRRELSSLTEGFMAIPSQDFDWEHHRPRLMAGGLAEILRALERVERDEDLTREQLLMLEATTFLFGGIGLHDDHSDWRLDIDNMSYEELLALGDRIGTVSTGLSEDAILRQLKKTTYIAALARSSEDDDVKCCICQEEFEEEVELGTIDCGHNYHRDCIRQWLLRKNTCPICKATALSSEPESPKSPTST